MKENTEAAIRINDIHKEFILPQSKHSSFKQVAVNIVKKNNKVTQKVLDGVSFDINKGDFFGVVGRNGSGKSTLLKLIAGVYSPTSGSIEVNGGLTPFIELGVGFNPELSGRDNVFLNGALLGFTRAQMTEMYDEIVEFAELSPFMDQKLKNYSSGMQVRLAFSIAIKAKNEILIFDEVLAVGDEAFQQKCLDIFERYKANGQTVVLVTHDMDTVRKFCNKAALISEGKLIEYGNPRKIADKYSALNQIEIDKAEDRKEDSRGLEDSAVIDLSVRILDSSGSRVKSFPSGTPFSIDVSWRANPKIDAFVVNVFKQSGEHVTAFRVSPGREDNFSINLAPRLAKGKYYLLVEMHDQQDRACFEPYEGATFMITSQNIKGVPLWSGITYVEHEVVLGAKVSES